MHCGKCGAFVSLKKRYLLGASTAILLWCKKCHSVLSVCFKGDC